MKPGKLRHSITIEKLTETQDDFGAVSEAWVKVVKTRARVEPLSGREFWSAKQVNSEAKYKVSLRYQKALASLDTKMRIVFGSRTFDIDSIINVEEKDKDVLIYCHD